MTQINMRQRVMFRQPGKTDDGAGNYEGPEQDKFSRFARIMPLRGGETVIDARLQGLQPAIITVRYDSQTQCVDPTWRVRDLASGIEYNIQSVNNPDEKRIYLQFMCVSGKVG